MLIMININNLTNNFFNIIIKCSGYKYLQKEEKRKYYIYHKYKINVNNYAIF